MSERGLVVHQGSLSTMENALADATTAITSQIIATAKAAADAGSRTMPGMNGSR